MGSVGLLDDLVVNSLAPSSVLLMLHRTAFLDGNHCLGLPLRQIFIWKHAYIWRLPRFFGASFIKSLPLFTNAHVCYFIHHFFTTFFLVYTYRTIKSSNSYWKFFRYPTYFFLYNNWGMKRLLQMSTSICLAMLAILSYSWAYQHPFKIVERIIQIIKCFMIL